MCLITFAQVLINADFAEMANDTEYQQEARQIMAEFSKADWEAWQMGERQFTGEDEK